MEVLSYYPFDRLHVPDGERVEWCGHNFTFHRSAEYGIALTREGLYLFRPFWPFISRWKRIPLNRIEAATFRDSRWMPSLRILASGRTEVLRTPFDYRDEMDFDRRKLQEAVQQIDRMRGLTSGVSGAVA